MPAVSTERSRRFMLGVMPLASFISVHLCNDMYDAARQPTFDGMLPRAPSVQLPTSLLKGRHDLGADAVEEGTRCQLRRRIGKGVSEIEGDLGFGRWR